MRAPAGGGSAASHGASSTPLGHARAQYGTGRPAAALLVPQLLPVAREGQQRVLAGQLDALHRDVDERRRQPPLGHAAQLGELRRERRPQLREARAQFRCSVATMARPGHAVGPVLHAGQLERDDGLP